MQNNKLDSKKEFLDSNDLVAMGLFPSADAAYLARRRGVGPDFIKFGSKVLYPVECLNAFIEKSMQSPTKATPFVDSQNNMPSASTTHESINE